MAMVRVYLILNKLFKDLITGQMILNNHWLESKIRRFRQESLYYFQKILYNIFIAGKNIV